MLKTTSFDPACRTLAEHFLQDEGNPNDHYRRDELAAHIQQAVEDWFSDHAPLQAAGQAAVQG